VRILLDTHAFVWWVNDARSLSRRARAIIAIPRNQILVSVASCWELAIQVSLRKLTLKAPIERFLVEQIALNDFELLPIQLPHVARVATLPFHHRDPFDRLLAAQALEESLTIVSADPVFRQYGVQRVW
jgi:PIN domain nuclease of toxin-antitoxin system